MVLTNNYYVCSRYTTTSTILVYPPSAPPDEGGGRGGRRGRVHDAPASTSADDYVVVYVHFVVNVAISQISNNCQQVPIVVVVVVVSGSSRGMVSNGLSLKYNVL